MPVHQRELKQRAKALRNNMTEGEKKLWYQFLSKYSVKFVRQKVLASYIADFYCHSRKLVIEIDGGQHYSEENYSYDQRRTKVLEDMGVRVIRYTNIDVQQKFEAVCEDIHRLCSTPCAIKILPQEEDTPILTFLREEGGSKADGRCPGGP